MCHFHHSQPERPYSKAVKIVHHDQYNFYNVATHTFFNQEGGRVIYLEGTYTDSFSGATEKTPRYNYNQVMYRVRLDDSRLHYATARALRRLGRTDEAARHMELFRLRKQSEESPGV